MNTHFLECHNINICQDVILTWQFEGKPSYKQQIILPQGINEIIFSFSGTVSFRYMSQKQTGYKKLVQGRKYPEKTSGII